MLFSVTTLSLLLAWTTTALPLDAQRPAKCTNPRIRKEWRTLSTAEQDAYIGAIQCLKSAPSKGTEFFSTLQNRYDDFVASHINATRGGQDAPSLVDSPPTNATDPPPAVFGVHNVGVFLPWHRYAIWVFESALRAECNYTGTQPYWDWTLDNPASNGSLSTSPIIKAFGGDGDEDTGCVRDGPFTGDAFLNIGPVESLASNPRCLTRFRAEEDFNANSRWEDIYPPLMSRRSHVQLQEFVDGLSFVADEDKVTTGAFMKPHSMGHSIIGGDFLDVYSSPNDPIFWVHHAQLDYMWALWQGADAARLADVGGARTVEGFGPGADEVEETTLVTPVWMGFLGEDTSVRAVMDTRNGDGEGVLCYEYEESPSLAGRRL